MDSQVASAKESTVNAMEWFLKVLSFVPDDELNWTPSPTAKSSLQIASHVAICAATFAQVLRTGQLIGGDVNELLATRQAAEQAVTTREQAIELFKTNTDGVLAALDALTPERIGGMVTTPGLSTPMTFFMNLPSMHAVAHASQIDYLQTCWDDQEVHV